MTTEVFNEIGRAVTKRGDSGEPQEMKDLKFTLPNACGLNGIFHTKLVGTDGVDAVELRLQGQGEPFTASITRETLLSDAVTLAPSGARTIIEKLLQKINPPANTSPVSVGRTRY